MCGEWDGGIKTLGTCHYLEQGADSLASQSNPCFGTKGCLRLWTLYFQQCINESPEGLRFKNKRVSNSSFPAFSLPPLSSVFFWFFGFKQTHALQFSTLWPKPGEKQCTGQNSHLASSLGGFSPWWHGSVVPAMVTPTITAGSMWYKAAQFMAARKQWNWGRKRTLPTLPTSSNLVPSSSFFYLPIVASHDDATQGVVHGVGL